MEKEKKEIWKLIELLNERDVGEECWELYYLSNGIIRDDWWNILYDYRTISKQFWFIKWLVENDKIDRENWGLLDNCMSEFDRYPISFDNKKLNDRAVDMLLMLLAIQDEPIRFLCEILK